MKKVLLFILILLTQTVVLSAQKDVYEKFDKLSQKLYNEAAYPEALNYTKKAMSIAVASWGGQDSSVARQYYSMALLYQELEANDSMLDALEKAAKILTENYPGSQLLVQVWSDLGDMMLLEENNEKALDYYTKTLAAADKANPEYHSYLDNLAYMYYIMGDYEKSEYYYSSRVLYLENRKERMAAEYADALNSLATIFMETGRYSDAEPVFLEALTLKTSENKDVYDLDLATMLNNLGSLYSRTGRHAEAEPMYKQAIIVVEKAMGPEHVYVAYSLNNLALLYEYMGRASESVAIYRKALNLIAAKEGTKGLNYTKALDNLAGYYRTIDSLAQAEKLYMEVLKNKKESAGAKSLAYAVSLNNLALVYRHQKRFDEAEKLYLESIAIKEKLFEGKSPSLAASCNNLALFYQKLGKWELSEQYYKQALWVNNKMSETSTTLDPKTIESLAAQNYLSMDAVMESLEGLNRLRMKMYEETSTQQYLNEAYKINLEAIKLHDIIRSDFNLEKNKLQLLSKHHAFFEYGIEAALKLDSLSGRKEKTQEAFEFAERNKSIVLLEALKAQENKRLENLPMDLVRQERDLQKKRSALQAGMSGGGRAKDSLQQSLNELNLEIDAFKKQLKKDYPAYYEHSFSKEIAKVESLQKKLGEKTAFIEFFVGQSTVYVFCITSNQFKIITLPIKKAELMERTTTLHHALSDYKFIVENSGAALEEYTTQAHWFYKELLAPIIKDLAVDFLILVPDDVLGHLPFEVFLVEKPKQGDNYSAFHYVLNDFKISYNYSATLWTENMEQIPKKSKKPMLAFAASYGAGKEDAATRTIRAPHLRNLRDALQDLPAAKQEVEGLSVFFKGDFLYGINANEGAFKAKAGDYGIIHLAMHGILNTQYPILSSLAFTENSDSSEDNFLQAYEIAQLQLNAQLVVLSACETGYGKFQQGEGVMSLARSFMYAGVPSLVVSMWQVNDASTSVIMQSFYKNLSKGMDKAEALRQAKLAYIGSVDNIAAHPAFWAAFVQLGDSRPIVVEVRSGGWSMWWVRGGLLAVAVVGGAVAMRRRRG